MPQQTGGAGGIDEVGVDPSVEAVTKKTPKPGSRKALLGDWAAGTKALYSAIDPSVLRNTDFDSPRTRDIYQAGLAGKLDISSIRTGEMFKWLSPAVIKQAPFTVAHYSSAQQDEGTLQAFNDTLVWYATAYGNENMGAFAMMHLINDPVSLQRTRDLALDITGLTGSGSFTTTGVHGLAGTVAPSAETSQENFEELLRDGSSPDMMQAAFDRMTPAERAGVKTLAQELLTSLGEAPSSALIDEFQRTVAVARDGYSVALDLSETRVIDQIITMASTGIGGTTQDINELGVENVNGVPTPQGDLGKLNIAAQQLGISQFTRKQGGVIVLDEADARAHPSDALAIKEYLEARYPEAAVTIGPQGAIGSFINKLGMPIDYISGLIAVPLHQGTERIQQLTADGDPTKTLQLVDEAEASIAGGLTPTWVRDLFSRADWLGDVENPADVQLMLDHMREQNTFSTSYSDMWKDLKDNTRPEQMGFGVGDTFTKAAGLLPGDDTYEATRVAISLVANIALDPLNYAGPIIGGVKAASRIQKFHATEESISFLRSTGKYTEAALTAMKETDTIALGITNSWIKQLTYMKLARYPEELVLTKTYISTVNDMWDIRQAAGSAEAFATKLVANGSMDLERARQFALATSREDMSIALLADSLGIGKRGTLDDVFGIIAKREEVSKQIADTAVDAPEFESLVAQRHFYDSAIQGTDAIRPFDSMPSYRQIRRLQQSVREPPTGIERAILATADNLKRFPSSWIPRTPAGMRRFDTAQEDVDAAREALTAAKKTKDAAKIRTAEKALKRAESDISYQARRSLVRSWGEFRNIWRNPGFGGRVVFEGAMEESTFTGIRQARETLARVTKTGVKADIKAAEASLASAEASMVGALNKGLEDLHAAARMLGIKDDQFSRLIEPFVSGSMKTDRVAQYKWMKDTWREMVDSSPKLSGLAKQELRDLYKVAVKDRAGTLMQGSEGVAVPVLTRHIPGDKLPYAAPSLSVDMARSVPLPSVEQLRELATNVGRSKTYYKSLPRDPRRAISSLQGWLAKGWQQGNSIWRSWVLGSRLVFGLPLRIIGEQQLRMAGFEYDSMVWHPIEWFRSTNWSDAFFDTPLGLTGDYGTARWAAAGSPEHALGSMIDNISPHWTQQGRTTVTIDDAGPAFFHAYSGEIAKFYKSPEVGRWRLVGGKVMSPQQYLALMKGSEEKGAAWLAHLESTVKPGQTTDEAVRIASERLTEDLTQLIGTGEGADYVKTAISLGHVAIDDVDYTVGTFEFGQALQKLADEGRWIPGKLELPTDVGQALTGMHPLQAFRDTLFKMFYSRPDLATSRVPLYHQVWQRQYDNLIKLGYSEERAVEVARSIAAGATADMMFQIGAHTSGEMFLRTIMPFFPAYRELATTWLYRLPVRLGQLRESREALLGWGLGATILTRRASTIMNAFEEAGFIQTDAQGKKYVAVPFLGGLVNWATGADTEWETNISLESAVGILPVPFGLNQTDENGDPLPWHERLRGALPTLGGMSVAAMALIKNRMPFLIGPLEDWSTMFGSDTSFGPHSLDMIWQTTHGGDAPPWVFGRTAAMQEANYQFAITDGMRLAMNEIPAPVWREGFNAEELKAFNKAQADWLVEIAERGNRYAHGMYFLKAVIGSALPFSISITDETRAEYGHLWEMLNRMPGGSEGQLARSMYSSVLAANPEMGAYAVPKSLDMRDVDDPERSIEAYMAGIADGTIKVRGDKEWALFAWGSTSRALHYATLSRIRREAGDTMAERMMNREANNQLEAENLKWETFLDWSEQSTKDLGYSQSLKDMFNTYDQYRVARGDEPQITTEQQALIDFDRSYKGYAQYFQYNYETADAYFKARELAYAALGKSKSEYGKATSWYFKKVGDPYYDKRDKLFESLKYVQPYETGLVFNKIARLTERYNHGFVNPDHPEWGTYPSPEEYSWSQKDPKDQARLSAKWATLKPQWLTEFQRNQAGYDIPQDDQAAVTKWAAYANKQHNFRLVAEHDLHINDNTLAQIANEELEAQRIAKYAKKLGITDVIAQFDAPTYERVGEAMNLANTTENWDKVVREAKWARAWLSSQDIGFTGGDAMPTRERFAKQIQPFIAADPALAAALTEIGAALEKTNIYDLYNYLFFDKYF